jgi:serine O-acetyltransferase
MGTLSSEDVLLKNITLLSTPSAEELEIVPQVGGPLPSIESLRKMVELVKSIVFPGFFDKHQVDDQIRSYYIGVNMEMLFSLLKGQIGRGLLFDAEGDEDEVKDQAAQLALQFIDRLPEIKRLLYTDVEAIFLNDPAVRNYGEVIFCYPVVQAMVHYRMAHELLQMGIPVIPRIITELAHSATGIDIHPGATIGEYFSIDHGTGVVIGETCIIGNHVTLYQGVTLGAKNFSLDAHGHPRNIPRHPILEDNVTVYSNSTVLGRITIGHDSVIGGNVWLTHDVPAGSHVLQNKAITSTFMDGLGI